VQQAGIFIINMVYGSKDEEQRYSLLANILAYCTGTRCRLHTLLIFFTAIWPVPGHSEKTGFLQMVTKAAGIWPIPYRNEKFGDGFMSTLNCFLEISPLNIRSPRRGEIAVETQLPLQKAPRRGAIGRHIRHQHGLWLKG
jgi:hypothetical protein